jgi:Ca-activated chloride channel family protein
MSDLRFTATAAFDRSLFWEGGASVRYLVARLNAQRAEELPVSERSPVNIALVIDASGSMQGGKLEAAKSAALGLAERLTENDRLTVVSFASDVQVHVDAVSVSEENLKQIKSEISLLRPRGMTNLSGGWFAAVEATARVAEEDERMQPRVIILSDGHANEGISDAVELQEHARELMLRGVLTSALGIGDGYDEQLLLGIAENGGGRLHDAEFASEISSVLLGELDDIFGTLIEGAQIRLTMPPETQIEVLGDDSAELHGQCLLKSIGPIQNDVERVVVFKITCPQAQRGNELLFSISACGKGFADRSTVETDATMVRLTAADSEANDGQSRDLKIAEIVARTWSAHVVSLAAKMNRDRSYDSARRYIGGELFYFGRYVRGMERGPQMVRELELLAHRVGRELSSRMRKEMVVQSSLVMESRVDRRGSDKASWSARLNRGD